MVSDNRRKQSVQLRVTMSNGEMSFQVVTSWLNDLIGNIFRVSCSTQSFCICYRLSIKNVALEPVKLLRVGVHILGEKPS